MVRDPSPWSFSFSRSRCREVTSFFLLCPGRACFRAVRTSTTMDERCLTTKRRHLVELRADATTRTTMDRRRCLPPSGTLELTTHANDDDGQTAAPFDGVAEGNIDTVTELRTPRTTTTTTTTDGRTPLH